MSTHIFRAARASTALFFVASLWPAFAAEKHFLYVAVPGIRNYVQYGGIGILVFDADQSYRFV